MNDARENSQMAVNERTESPVASRTAGALDLGGLGIRAAMSYGSAVIPIDLEQSALSPASLITVKEDSAAPLGVPFFRSLLDRLGEELPVIVNDSEPQKAQVHVRNLLARLADPLQQWWGPVESLAVVVSAFATDLQRSLILREAKAAGWPRTQLVNKTTAFAIHALQRSRPGVYLALVLGHGPAEASVLQWEANELKPLSYSKEPGLSGEQLDRLLLQHGIQALLSARGKPLPLELYSRKDWLWVRDRIERVRRCLDQYETVTLEVPPLLTDGLAADLIFSRESELKQMAPVLDLAQGLIDRCCREAGVSLQRLQGCVATGGLLWQRAVRDRLMEVCAGTRLTVFAPDAQVLGACRLATRADIREADSTKLARPGSGQLRIAAPALPPTSSTEQDTFTTIISRARSLATAGKMAEARQQIAEVRNYLNAVELSLVPPADVIRALAGVTGPTEAASTNNKPHTPEEIKTVAADPERAGKAEQRKFALAKHNLKEAEAALKDGRLEQAVRVSHGAYKTSGDGRIFRAMIEVHLRAAAKRPPTPQTFEEDRRWLLCALADDGTNEQVQKAVVRRFLVHAQQLSDLGTERAHSEAITVLNQLADQGLLDDQAEKWLSQLKEATPGSVKLTLARGES
ncbi:MAG TPA: Hsp70 family protein [Candidatus Angelobacter sp.]|nr:Hsp70 family protein [Candidatus Angelobacter sp.]